MSGVDPARSPLVRSGHLPAQVPDAMRAAACANEGDVMAKEETLEFEGAVTDVLPDGRFRVQLDNGHAIIAYTAGRMKRNRIKTIAGDRVTVEMTPYDLEKGRVVFRHKTDSGPRPGGGGPRRGGGGPRRR
jgi:translation initiation factor IF-1